MRERLGQHCLQSRYSRWRPTRDLTGWKCLQNTLTNWQRKTPLHSCFPAIVCTGADLFSARVCVWVLFFMSVDVIISTWQDILGQWLLLIWRFSPVFAAAVSSLSALLKISFLYQNRIHTWQPDFFRVIHIHHNILHRTFFLFFCIYQ